MVDDGQTVARGCGINGCSLSRGNAIGHRGIARSWGIAAALTSLSLVLAGLSAVALRAEDSHQRILTLDVVGHDAFGQVTGTVNDDYPPCSTGVRVIIQRFHEGNWQWVATATTGRDGSYDTPIRAAKGNYRAQGQEMTLANGETCARRTVQPCEGVQVAAGVNLRAVTRKHGAGTTFCLAVGDYTVTRAIVLNPGDVISGAGRTATVITAAPNVDLIFKYSSSNTDGVLTFRHLSVGGANTPNSFHCDQGSCGSVMLSIDVVHANDVRCFGNATTCLSGGSHDVVLSNFECDGNGWHPDSLANAFQSSSCIKMSHGSLKVTDSYFHDNLWDAIWCDYCDQTFLHVQSSRFIHNGRAGVTWEVSGNTAPGDHALVEGNLFSNNGWNPNAPNGSGGHAGIIISDASNMEIVGNTFGGNLALDSTGTRAVLLYDGPRDPAPIHGISIHGNLLNGDRIQSCTMTGVSCSSNSA